MNTFWPFTTSRVCLTTKGSPACALIPKKFHASSMCASPQPDSTIACASVTEANTPVSPVRRLSRSHRHREERVLLHLGLLELPADVGRDAYHSGRAASRRRAGSRTPSRNPARAAEREGFEPSRHLSAPTRFPVVLLRPLGHLSEAAKGSRSPAVRSGGYEPPIRCFRTDRPASGLTRSRSFLRSLRRSPTEGSCGGASRSLGSPLHRTRGTGG